MLNLRAKDDNAKLYIWKKNTWIEKYPYGVYGIWKYKILGMNIEQS